MAIRAEIFNNLDFGGYNDILQKHVNDALNRIGYKLMIYARNNHRYQHRTGNLKASTRYSVNKAIGRVKLYISEGQAHYGKYVHEGHGHGHGKWSPDRFIDDAIRANTQFIDTEMNKAINKATKEWNRNNRI